MTSCPSTQVYHNQAFVREVFAWTGLGFLVFVARFAVRLRIIPWRKLQGDDYMATLSLVFFLLCIATKMHAYWQAPISDFTQDQVVRLLDCQVKRLELSSKLYVSTAHHHPSHCLKSDDSSSSQLVLWYSYASFLWSLKAMVLFFFDRLPLRRYQRRMHKVFSILSGLAYVAVMLTITFTCTPSHLGWTAIPYPPPQCTYRTQLLYTISISNAATDVAIITVALPLLWQLKASLQRRIELTLLLCSGIFVTAACLVSFFMSMTDPDSSLNVSLWGTREEIAGIVAVNAPIIRPLFRPSFWKKDFDPSKKRTRRSPAVRVGMVERPILDISNSRRPGFIAMLSRRLGILTSLQSLSSGPTTTTKAKAAPLSGGPTMHTTVETLESQRIEEGEFKDLEWAWAVPGTVVETDVVARGPRPLLPDPTPSHSSRGTLYEMSGLQSISEVEEEERIGVLVEMVTATTTTADCDTTDLVELGEKVPTLVNS